MERVVVTRGMVGICHMQVCAVADATDEEILEVCNRKNPSGTLDGWCVVNRNGSSIDCEKYGGRKHLLVTC